MFKSIASALRLFYDVYVRQFRMIIHDGGLVIFFLFLPLAYPVIYSLIYNPELVRDVKVVVVDHDRTPESRKLVQRFDATQGVSVLGYAADLGEGRRAMNSHHCYGIMEIPAGYGRKLGQGAKSPVVLYCEMSLLLRYRAMLISATETQLALGAEIQAQEIDNAVPMGASFRIGDPMPIENISIGVTQGGFDSFIMIGVLVFILHQCIVLSVAMMGGAYRERPELFYMNPFARPRPVLLSMLARVLVVMTIIVGPICFLIHYVPLMFAFPMAGNPFQIFAFLLPMVIACCFFGRVRAGAGAPARRRVRDLGRHLADARLPERPDVAPLRHERLLEGRGRPLPRHLGHGGLRAHEHRRRHPEPGRRLLWRALDTGRRLRPARLPGTALQRGARRQARPHKAGPDTAGPRLPALRPAD